MTEAAAVYHELPPLAQQWRRCYAQQRRIAEPSRRLNLVCMHHERDGMMTAITAEAASVRKAVERAALRAELEATNAHVRVLAVSHLLN
jgi:hypothetical protein